MLLLFATIVIFAACHSLRCFRAPMTGKQSFNWGASASEDWRITSTIAFPAEANVIGIKKSHDISVFAFFIRAGNWTLNIGLLCFSTPSDWIGWADVMGNTIGAPSTRPYTCKALQLIRSTWIISRSQLAIRTVPKTRCLPKHTFQCPGCLFWIRSFQVKGSSIIQQPIHIEPIWHSD